MTDTPSDGPSAGDGPPVRITRGLRITLLSLAVAILLLGAATAGIYGYVAMSHSSAAAAATRVAAGQIPTDRLDIPI